MSILSAKIVPPFGGDTLFASAVAAYESLSLPMQSFLEGLTAEHDVAHSFTAERHGKEPLQTGTHVVKDSMQRFEEAKRLNPPTVHPVVRTHPVSGRKGIYV